MNLTRPPIEPLRSGRASNQEVVKTDQDRRLVSLRFTSRELEKEYQRSLDKSRIQIVRIGIAIGAALNIMYSGWDRLVFTSTLIEVTAIRQVIMNAFLAILFGMTFLPRLRSSANLILAAVVIGYQVFFASINTLEPTPYIFVANGVLVFIFAYLFIAGDLRLAFGTGLAASGIFLAILATTRHLDREFALFALLVVGTNFTAVCFAFLVENVRRQEFMTTKELAAERSRSRELLLRVLPARVADRLQQGEVVADLYSQVVVLFADIVGFTTIAARHPPDVVAAWLNDLYAEFDQIIEGHGLEKIKTIGDAYMAAHGLGTDGDCERCAQAALSLIELTSRKRTPDGVAVKVRVGLNVGPATAGIIGNKRFLYDLWGDTVNVASRMESVSLPGAVLITADVKRRLGPRFEFEPCVERDIKGKGIMQTWILRANPPRQLARADGVLE
jgi:adenylate cyclase